MRAGLAALIKSLPGFEVVGEADDGLQLLELVREPGADIAILDISMPMMSGVDVARRIAQEHPEVKTIALSMHKSDSWVLRALKAGCQGYVVKDSSVDELKQALVAVSKGDMYLSPRISRKVLTRLLDKAGPNSLYDELSDRQREILTLLVDGRTSRQIAERLHLSPKTVEWHRAQIMDKLGLENLASLVRFAIRTGIVEP